MSALDRVIRSASHLGLQPALEAQLVDRLARGSEEYGDRSFHRPTAELIGEMLEEALDIIGWALIEQTGQRLHADPHAAGAPSPLTPIIGYAGAMAEQLDRLRTRALQDDAEGMQ